jgi:peptidoglycan/LPS O-acetylase OafA/YrhL
MSEVKKSTQENHLAILDGLRGIAILQVVLFHLWQLSWFDISQALHIAQIGQSLHLPAELTDTYFIPATGFMGVELFFFLSGFCLLYPLAGRHLRGDALPSWKTYFARRAWKIIPSYWLAMAIALWVSSPEHRTPQHILTHVFFIHNWFYETKGSINGVMWSLGVEVQFYCLFPFIAPFFLRRPAWGFAILASLGLLWRGIVLHYYPKDGFNLSHFNNQMPAALDLFALGMLGAYLVAYCQQKESEKKRLLFPGWLGLLIALLGTAIMLGLLRFLQFKSGEEVGIDRFQNQWRFPYGFACFLLAVGSALAPKFWKNLLANKLLVFFGFISYNWYLWHQWLAAWLYKTHWVASQTPEPHDDQRWQPVFFVIVFFGGMQITKWLTEYFEQPFMRWGKKRA